MNGEQLITESLSTEDSKNCENMDICPHISLTKMYDPRAQWCKGLQYDLLV
jgi:hypothetical protein